jgi:predicted restriction endonuclease
LELEKKEYEYIKQLNPIGNKIIPTRTRVEYYKDNCETIKEKVHAWKIANPEKYKAGKKAEYEKNKDKYNQRSKESYQKNRARNLEKINCDCGGHYVKMGRNRHLKTKRHTDYESI